MRPVKQRIQWKVSRPLAAVKLEEHPGSSLPDPTNSLIEIPTGTLIEVEGSAGGSGLINVFWNGDAFSVFHDDLVEKARIFEAGN